MLYSIQFLHQITTPQEQRFRIAKLYSIQFLHQITTMSFVLRTTRRCIVSNFYIKSQPTRSNSLGMKVV